MLAKQYMVKVSLPLVFASTGGNAEDEWHSAQWAFFGPMPK